MPSHTKLTPGHEEFIYQRRKELGEGGKPRHSGNAIRLMLARGIKGEPPVSITADRVLKVARRLIDERDELYNSQVQNRPAPEGLRIMTRRLMLICERELNRQERAERAGRLDAAKLAKLAQAMLKLDALLRRLDDGDGEGHGSNGPDKKGDSSQDGDAVPSPFEERLITDGDQGTGGAESHAAAPGVADVVIGPSRSGLQ